MAEEWSVENGPSPLDHGVDDGAWEDPVVAEVHAARERLWEQAGSTLQGLYALLKASESARSASVVRLPGSEAV